MKTNEEIFNICATVALAYTRPEWAPVVNPKGHGWILEIMDLDDLSRVETIAAHVFMSTTLKGANRMIEEMK